MGYKSSAYDIAWKSTNNVYITSIFSVPNAECKKLVVVSPTRDIDSLRFSSILYGVRCLIFAPTIGPYGQILYLFRVLDKHRNEIRHRHEINLQGKIREFAGLFPHIMNTKCSEAHYFSQR